MARLRSTLGQRGCRGLTTWASSYLDAWLALGHKEEVGMPWAQGFLSCWPSPWQRLMIILLSVNIYHPCGSKGRKPWTVPGRVGRLQEARRALPVASDPLRPTTLLVPSPTSWPTAPGDLRQQGPWSIRTKLLPCSLEPRSLTNEGTPRTQRGAGAGSSNHSGVCRWPR